MGYFLNFAFGTGPFNSSVDTCTLGKGLDIDMLLGLYILLNWGKANLNMREAILIFDGQVLSLYGFKAVLCKVQPGHFPCWGCRKGRSMESFQRGCGQCSSVGAANSVKSHRPRDRIGKRRPWLYKVC